LRPNLTVSTGIRYETQNNIHDHNDWAPRIAIAWAPGAGKGGTGKTVIRTGWGIFYDRFDESNVLSALRYNGTTQENYQLTASPSLLLSSYPNLPPSSSLTGALTTQNIYRIDPTVRAPYMMQAALGLERALPKKSTLAVNLINSRGDHVLRTRDINAPLPGTYTGSGTGVVRDVGDLQTDPVDHEHGHAVQHAFYSAGLLCAGFRAQQCAGAADEPVRYEPRLGARAIRCEASRVCWRQCAGEVGDQRVALYHDELGFTVQHHDRQCV
jgi:hypothetical protein